MAKDNKTNGDTYELEFDFYCTHRAILWSAIDNVYWLDFHWVFCTVCIAHSTDFCRRTICNFGNSALEFMCMCSRAHISVCMRAVLLVQSYWWWWMERMAFRHNAACIRKPIQTIFREIRVGLVITASIYIRASLDECSFVSPCCGTVHPYVLCNVFWRNLWWAPIFFSLFFLQKSLFSLFVTHVLSSVRLFFDFYIHPVLKVVSMFAAYTRPTNSNHMHIPWKNAKLLAFWNRTRKGAEFVVFKYGLI